MTHETGLYTGYILKERYVILSLLGKGGMGQVYLAQDLRLEGKLWAIKEVKANVEQKAFTDEARMLAGLNHPSLPNIVDYYPADKQGYCFIVMDYIQGKSIAELYEKDKQHFHVQEIITYMLELCDVFSYLHKQKPYPIIYRDLKPSNLMLGTSKKIFLIDFGIARLFQQEKLADTRQIGTIGFAAPEQYLQQQSDQRTDIYQLGALLHYLLTGATYSPFLNQTFHSENCRATESAQIKEQHTKGTFIYEERFYDKFLPIIHHATKYQPGDRYSSVEELAADIRKLEQDVRLLLKENDEKEREQQGLHQGQDTQPLEQTENRFQRRSDYVEQKPNDLISWGRVGSEDMTVSEQLALQQGCKFILIGSLWHGAGVTTLATNLARCLAAKNVKVAYVEYPTVNPYMFDYLNLSAEENSQNTRDEKQLSESWNLALGKLGSVVRQCFGVDWYVNDPRQTRQEWSYEALLQLTHSLRSYSCVILDVSTQWLHSSLVSFLEQADHIYLCIEPDPIKIDWLQPAMVQQLDVQVCQLQSEQESYSLEAYPAPYQLLATLLQLDRQGKDQLELITLKMYSKVKEREWNECLFATPLTSFPYLPYPDVLQHIWSSTFIYDQDEFHEQIEAALRPIVHQIYPQWSRVMVNQTIPPLQRKGIFKRWRLLKQK